jgi:hypothetical protein
MNGEPPFVGTHYHVLGRFCARTRYQDGRGINVRADQKLAAIRRHDHPLVADEKEFAEEIVPAIEFRQTLAVLHRPDDRRKAVGRGEHRSALVEDDLSRRRVRISRWREENVGRRRIRRPLSHDVHAVLEHQRENSFPFPRPPHADDPIERAHRQQLSVFGENHSRPVAVGETGPVERWELPDQLIAVRSRDADLVIVIHCCDERSVLAQRHSFDAAEFLRVTGPRGRHSVARTRLQRFLDVEH